MLKILMNNANIWSEAQGTNVRWALPQATKIVLIVLCFAVVPLLAAGCETKTGYEKTTAAWEECKMPESELTTERGVAVLDKYRSLFERQPNFLSESYGVMTNEDTGEYDWDRVGITIIVSKKVDQSTLPDKDRIPDCLEGVPVQVVEGSIDASPS